MSARGASPGWRMAPPGRSPVVPYHVSTIPKSFPASGQVTAPALRRGPGPARTGSGENSYDSVRLAGLGCAASVAWVKSHRDVGGAAGGPAGVQVLVVLAPGAGGWLCHRSE